jgi:hypothetical protein
MPGATFYGVDTISYRISDGFRVAGGTVTVTVQPPTIIANPDSAFTVGTAPVTIDLLGNDFGASLAITALGTPDHGSLTDNLDGTVDYEADAAFAGTDSFEYTIEDAFNASAVGEVSITVQAPPIFASADSASTVTTTMVAIPALANDVGVGIEITSVANPPHGSATIAGSTIEYTADGGFTGLDSFSYQITDDYGQTSSTLISVLVTSAPPVPVVANPDSAQVTAGESVTISVLANDEPTSGLTVIEVSNPPNGTATIGPAGLSVIYQPDALYLGSDSFTYRASNGVSSATATVTVVVVAPPIQAVDDTSTTVATAPVVANVAANDVGQGLIVSAVGDPTHGTATIVAGGISYVADGGFDGDDPVSYTIQDIYGQTDTGLLTVTVQKAPPPSVVANPDLAAAVSGVPTEHLPLANDVSLLPLTIASVTTPLHGTAIKSTGDTQVLYTAAVPYVGQDSYDYTATNGPVSATSTVTVTVTAPPLLAVDDEASTVTTTPVDISVLSNDQGVGKTVSAVADPPNGTATRVDLNTRVRYVADGAFIGDDTFNYTVQDAFGQTDTGSITVHVAPAVVPVVANPDSATLNSGTAVEIFVLANDLPITGLTVGGVTQPLHGGAAKPLRRQRQLHL